MFGAVAFGFVEMDNSPFINAVDAAMSETKYLHDVYRYRHGAGEEMFVPSYVAKEIQPGTFVQVAPQYVGGILRDQNKTIYNPVQGVVVGCAAKTIMVAQFVPICGRKAAWGQLYDIDDVIMTSRHLVIEGWNVYSVFRKKVKAINIPQLTTEELRTVLSAIDGPHPNVVVGSSKWELKRSEIRCGNYSTSWSDDELEQMLRKAARRHNAA